MESSFGGWISIKEEMPKPEEIVLLHTVSKVGGKRYHHVTIGMHEDGNVYEGNSYYGWDIFGAEEIENYDEEKDDFRVPEGWWEVGMYEVIGKIDDEVIAWMPLPRAEETC